MIQITKYTVSFILAFFIYNYVVDTFKSSPKQKPKTSIKQEQVLEVKKKPKSLFETPTPPPKKEVVFYLEEGQELKENQVYIKTPEGKAQYEKNIGWLIDLCDRYALKQRKLAEENAKKNK